MFGCHEILRDFCSNTGNIISSDQESYIDGVYLHDAGDEGAQWPNMSPTGTVSDIVRSSQLKGNKIYQAGMAITTRWALIDGIVTGVGIARRAIL